MISKCNEYSPDLKFIALSSTANTRCLNCSFVFFVYRTDGCHDLNSNITLMLSIEQNKKKKCKIKTNTNTTIQMKWWNVIFFSPSGRFVEILWAQANIDCVSCGRNAFGRLKHQRSTVDIVVFSPSHDRAIVHVHMLTMSVRTLSIEPNVIFTLQLNTSNISLATWSTLPAKWLVVFVVDVSVHLRCKIYI